MKMHTILACGTALALAAGSVNAATIQLVDLGGVTGSVAEKDFKIAAAFWGNLFSNNATIKLGVGFSHFSDPRTIGATGSTKMDFLTAEWETRVNATKSGSSIDANIVLPALNGGFYAPMITQGTDASGGNDTTKQVYAPFDYSGAVLYENTSVVKAVGGTAVYNPTTNPLGLDGSVNFSQDFAFDFDPTDGVDFDKMDFLGVAIHEIGHALGFTSGVDFFDAYGAPHGPGYSLGYDLNDTSIFTALDMFRYSNDPHGVGPGGPQLDETVGTASYFSIDGGLTALYGNSFSTGAYNGDGNQASHWKDSATCSGFAQLGVMDPTVCFGQMGVVKGLDLAAFDAIGWNLRSGANPTYTRSTAQIYGMNGSVPEPASWALMLGGFGLIGAAMRRQRTAISFG